MSEKFESRYTITQSTDKTMFRIEGGKDRCPVEVKVEETKIVVSDPAIKYKNYEMGLFEFHKMLESIALVLMSDWQAPKDRPKAKKCQTLVDSKIAAWAKVKCKKSLAKRVKAVWIDMLQTMPSNITSLQKRAFSVMGKSHNNLYQPDLYRQEFVVKDIMNHRAAAMAIPYLAFGQNGDFRGWELEGNNVVYDDDVFEEDPFFGYGHSLTKKNNTQNLRQNWMELYSVGEPNTSLRKTLMSMPGGIPSWLITSFRGTEFRRPITDRLELLTAIAPVFYHRNILQFAKRDEIKRAIRSIERFRHETTNLRKSNSVFDALRFIVDYPEVHHGRLVGLAQRSIAYHRDHQFLAGSRQSQYSANQQVARPPIPLPDIKGIKFVDNVGDLWSIGEQNKFCLASYDRTCVKGESFIFTCEHKGEFACAEVDRQGRVTQSRTYRNQTNKACKYLSKKLDQWAKPWREQSLSSVKYPYINEEINQPVLAVEDIPF